MDRLTQIEQLRLHVDHDFDEPCLDTLLDEIDSLEAQVAAADALADGRPCPTDVWLAAALECLDDCYDLRQAIKEWVHGDWDSAMDCVELPKDYNEAKKGGA